ncbi:hypothetical protein H2200_007094 [Cladophialophora chaetospira]|uniref:Glycosyltransferase 2-like domain-containing protein n=1 Tax=Cladophialophora chaetospira TaxID=386627 RepID=A0AA38X7A0_9EURO|nr:hypothetical protein H2200_007094 [Cladophialophora chaetospira]
MAGEEASVLRERLINQHLNKVGDGEPVNANGTIKTTVDKAKYDDNAAASTGTEANCGVTKVTVVAPEIVDSENATDTDATPDSSQSDDIDVKDSERDQPPAYQPNPSKLNWIKPVGPYTVKTHKAKALKPVTAAKCVDDVLRPLGLISLLGYLGITALQAQSSNLLSCITVFAVAQVSENIGHVLEGLWAIAMRAASDPYERADVTIIGDNVPSVDVFIVCCGEPDDVVIDTVKAACHIDWPASKLRVIVADDEPSPTLRQEVGKLQASHPNLHYYSRVKPVEGSHGYKAGNLNGTLVQFIEKTKQGYSEYIAVLDADMMPEPNILRILVPHAVEDDRMAMVTAAQFHYNVPNDDPLNQGNSTGPGAEDGKRDRINAAWCPGSGFIIRTEAWADIGTFPMTSITEDLITSWRLHGKGWKIALIPGKMQWGLQPDCLLTHLKQRRRWWTGHIPDAIEFNFTLKADALRGATFMQRYAMFHHACRPYTMTIIHAISTILTLICLAFGGSVIDPSNIDSVKKILFWLTLHRVVDLAGTLKILLTDGVQEYLKNRRMVATGVWMSHHFSRDTLQTLLPKSLGGLRLGFVVSGLNGVAVKERDVLQRQPLWKRLRLVHQQEGVLWHLVLFLVASSLVIYRVAVQVKDATVNGKVILTDNFWLQLVTSVGFPGLGLIENAPYYLTPIIYLIFPPTMPARRETMKQDPQTGLWIPREGYKDVKYTMKS